MLSLNTDKVQYSFGEQVNIQITSLNNEGSILCNSSLELSIIKEGRAIEQPGVTHSSTCDPDNTATLNPDYTAYFAPLEEGEYQIKVTNLDSNDSSELQITVGDNQLDYSISRWGAHRVNPQSANRYPMKLILTANKDFTGKLVDQIPLFLEVVWYGPAKVEESESGQTVTWEIDIKEGETKEFTYEYKIPNDTSDNFPLGPSKLVSKEETYFEEIRPWNITINHN